MLLWSWGERLGGEAPAGAVAAATALILLALVQAHQFWSERGGLAAQHASDTSARPPAAAIPAATALEADAAATPATPAATAEKELRALEELPVRQLIALAEVGLRQRNQAVQLRGMDRAELVGAARAALRAAAAARRVLCSPELGRTVLLFLDRRGALALAQCSRGCRELADSDALWRREALRAVVTRDLPRLPPSDAVVVARALKAAHERRGFFRPMADAHSAQRRGWKSFFAAVRRLEASRLGGNGRAVIMPREHICPHHILRFVNSLSIAKHGSIVLPALIQFLRLYRSRGGNLNLRATVGYCFVVRKLSGVQDRLLDLGLGEGVDQDAADAAAVAAAAAGNDDDDDDDERRRSAVDSELPLPVEVPRRMAAQGVEGFSHRDFSDLVRASDLSVNDLLRWFQVVEDVLDSPRACSKSTLALARAGYLDQFD
jgi:hypothetical protein